MALSEDQKEYMRVQKRILDQCIHTHYAYICPTQAELLDTKTNPGCEIRMLLNPSEQEIQTRDVRITTVAPTWNDIPSDGSWLYSNVEPEALRLACPGKEDKSIILGGIGILNIGEGCMGYTTNAKIITENIKLTDKQYIYKPIRALNLSNLYPILHHFSEPDEKTPIFEELTPQDGTWKQHERTIGKIMDKIKVVGNYHLLSTYHSRLLYGGLGINPIVVAVVCILIIKYCKAYCIFPTYRMLTESQKRTPAT